MNSGGERCWVIWMPEGCGQSSEGWRSNSSGGWASLFICRANMGRVTAGQTLSVCLSLVLLGMAARVGKELCPHVFFSPRPLKWDTAESEQDVPPRWHLLVCSVQTSFWRWEVVQSRCLGQSACLQTSTFTALCQGAKCLPCSCNRVSLSSALQRLAIRACGSRWSCCP